MKDIKRINQEDLSLLKSFAKDFLLQIPRGARFRGMQYPLSEGDLIAVSYAAAALSLFNSKGIDTNSLIVEFDIVTSDSSTE